MRPPSPTSIPPSRSLLAAILLHEPVTVWTIVGFVLVISLYSWLVTSARTVDADGACDDSSMPLSHSCIGFPSGSLSDANRPIE